MWEIAIIKGGKLFGWFVGATDRGERMAKT